MLGYGLAALTKPIFPLAPSIGWVFGARFVDRIGKGIRGAPRDALIADIVSPEMRGAGLWPAPSARFRRRFRRTRCSPWRCMFLLANNIRAVLWIAVIPAFLCVALIVFGVREPDDAKSTVSRKSLAFADAKRPLAALLADRGARRGVHPRPLQRGIP